MQYEVKDKGDCILVELQGEVDLFNSPRAREVILGALADKRNVLVDLSEVAYIDSSGVASLVEGYQTAKNTGVQFGLVSVSEAAMSVLQLAHLDKVFPIHASMTDFLASVSQ